MTRRQRLVLIDGYSNIFRAFYAIRNLSNSKGEPTNAVYGFVQMLRKLLRDESPELVGVAFDVSGPTVRDEKFEGYKANRAPMPEDLRPQIPWIRKAIEAYRIPILEMEGYEADDVLGTLARKAAECGYDVILVSTDKDLVQLVDEHVSLFHTGRDRLYDPQTVEEDFGVPPHQMIEVLALKGDAVDNVPGVPGIGEKGAVQLVRQYGTLEELLERAEEVSRKSYREGLQAHRDQALLSKDLVTIHTDLEIEFKPEELRCEEPDAASLRDIYKEMEFHSLLAELDSSETGDGISAADEITSLDEWRERSARIGKEIALAAVGPGEPVGLVVSDEHGPFFADFRQIHLRENVCEALREWLSDAERTVVGHDLKEVLRIASPLATPRAWLVDTMLLSYVLRPSTRSHGLEDVVRERLGLAATLAKDAGWKGDEAPPPGFAPMLSFAAERSELPRQLAPSMLKELGTGPLASVYREIEEPLISVLVGMEEKGVLLDSEYLGQMSQELRGELESLEAEIHDLAGEEFNINSPRQLGVVLFEKLGYPVIKKTRKTKSYSTSAESLQQLAEQGYRLAELLLRFRELSKLKSTYIDALPGLVGSDGRLHTRFQQAVAATGRLSSISPNLQNIPVRTELGQRIRKAFVAPSGYQLLIADYNQIELRVLAHIALDPVLIESFASGEDIHRTTAAAVFGVAPELVSAEQRRAAKMINFGIIYGISAFGLARNLRIGPAEADTIIRAYFERYAGVRRYIDETLDSALAEGKVETLYGRVRWLPDIQSSNRNLRDNARRMAINARIQGTAADLMKRAMVRLDRRLRRDHPDASLLLTVHDELVLEVADAEIESVADVVREEMEGVETLAVPLVVDLGSGRSWYDAKA